MPDLYDLYDLNDLYDLYDLNDLNDLYDLPHVAGWELYILHDQAHFPGLYLYC